MNFRAKSIFVSLYPMLSFAAVVYAAMLMIMEGFSWSYLGLLLSAIPFNLFLIQLYTTSQARTDPNLMPYSILVMSGLLLSLFASFSMNPNIGLLTVSLFFSLLWLVYLYWYSSYGDRSDNIFLAIGEQLPSFELEDLDGRLVLSEDLLGKRSIWMFYRGNWCPICMAQIKEIAGMYKKLDEMNIQTILVSPQPQKHSRKLANKWKLNFRFLVDNGSKAARKLGILVEKGLPMGLKNQGYDQDTLMPTLVLTDESGQIIYSDLTSNYRIRPEPKDFLKVFQAHVHASLL